MILNENQINHIVDAVNKKVNIPILGEKAEAKLIRKFVVEALEKLEEILSPEVLAYVNNASAGLVKGANLKEAKKRTVKMVNKDVNIPFISERREAQIFTIIIDIIFDAMQQGKELLSKKVKG